jgi:hypothetical protein
MKNRLEQIGQEILCEGLDDKQISGVKKCKYFITYKKIECKVLIQNRCYFNTTFEKENVVLHK